MPLGLPLGSPLGGEFGPSAYSASEEVARQALVNLFPPGDYYDFDNQAGDVYKTLAAFGQAVKRFGFDVADRLFWEGAPYRAVERLRTWEEALGLTNNTETKSTAARQSAIVSKLRESSASTIPLAQAVVGPLLGYADNSTLSILETDRTAETSAHSYALSGAFGASGNTTYSVRVYDDGSIDAPVILTLAVTLATSGTLTFLVTHPLGGTVSKSFTYTNPSQTFVWRFQTFAGLSPGGTWSVRITNPTASTGTLSASLFVEGNRKYGLGAEVFSWGAYANPALVNSPDYVSALAAIKRITPAHADGYLITGLSANPDGSTTIPNQILPV